MRSSAKKLVGQSRLAEQQRGFSFPEIAIILALLALLVGSVLLGNGLVTQARAKSQATDFVGLGLAVSIYVERYGALPGDDPQAELRWPGRARNGTGDWRISGDYAASAPTDDPLATLSVDGTGGESLNFWWHLRLADLLPTPPATVTPVAQPLNHFRGVVGVEWGVLGFPALAGCAANLPGDVAIAIENQLDDGDPRRGFIRAARQTTANQPLNAADATVTTFTASDNYILCERLD